MKCYWIPLLFAAVGARAAEDSNGNTCNANYARLLELNTQEQTLRLELETRVRSLQDQVESLQSSVDRLTVEMVNSKKQVAFSGKLSRNIPSSEGKNVANFDTVITNVGNAYSTTTGVFTCPVSGIYLFVCNIVGGPTGQTRIRVYHNGKAIGRPWTGNGVHEPGADSTVIHAEAGDEVYVKDLITWSINLDNFSKFTGVLIKAD
ncbi:complement C1q-like protein 4 [Mercenaria mercenaria]|uniref:complement C1q-like protein 4 n=1 Tax=Mercenaria mercenaria TaxID=6596 RepID=UPI00234EB557|nr:complement C1q-like protein 4 [Mercenaria mercenaria]